MKMRKKVFLGIDTSNYTTSCAVADLNGQIIENYKILLPVKHGENGLRQSDAVFAHIKNFEIIASNIREKHADYDIIAVGCSAYPRDCENSYMPCFLVGKAFSQMLGAIYNIDTYYFSHQMGHVQAAIYSSGVCVNDDFIAFHVSGGTTEILHVSLNEETYTIEQIGGSIDLHAGQAIDRMGVKMGMKFPCGREMEARALENKKMLPGSKICVNGLDCNISGLENIANKLFEETKDIPLVSDFIFDFLSKTLIKLTANLRKKYKDKKIVFAGGVMSNSIIQNRLNENFEDVYFAKPEFSTDNASGIAILTMKRFFGRR